MEKKAVQIMWFRRDLRLEDNAAFYQALKSGRPVVPIFIFDRLILDKLKNKFDPRVQFIRDRVSEMKTEFARLGLTFLVFDGKPEEVFRELVHKFSVEAVFTNHDYEPYAISRDAKIGHLLREHNIEFKTFKDQCIFEKREIVKDDGKPYTVFTPYKNKWLNTVSSFYLKSYPTEKYLNARTKLSSPKINKNILRDYAPKRDFPALDATSHLGVHLRFGTISIRQCAQIAKKTSEVWLSELIWRDFFMQILFHFPHVEKESFREEYDRIEWRNDKKEFKAWCEGQTGYPLVDAGMRELNSTGHMHNRARMITASFLTKHLLIDWRWGEAYFAEKLLDFDMAANNGNWQWAAGTGCDAAPYFRIFNPETQQKKFDPQFTYVKRWIPEFETEKYPRQIVEHSFARARALLAYKKALKND